MPTLQHIAKLLLLAAALALAPHASAEEPAPFFGLQQDKILHFSVSAVVSSGSIKLLQAADERHEVTVTNRIASSLFTLGLGYAKEQRDARERGQPIDAGDMTANVLGIITGNLLQWQF